MIVKSADLTNTGSLELPRASPDFIEGNNIMTFPFFDEDIRQHIHEAWEERTERRTEKKEWHEAHQ